jgi:hypothetical protein
MILEYEKLLDELHVRRLQGFVDPVERWAVRSKRKQGMSQKSKTTKRGEAKTHLRAC